MRWSKIGWAPFVLIGLGLGLHGHTYGWALFVLSLLGAAVLGRATSDSQLAELQRRREAVKRDWVAPATGRYAIAGFDKPIHLRGGQHFHVPVGDPDPERVR